MPERPVEPDLECRQCRQRVPRRSSTARFCPHCGFAFVDPPADAPSPQALEALRREASGHLNPTRSEPIERFHSLVLLGYANAMLHLGWRYEQGSGVARNSQEAERCYLKSAKLGNIFARARLTDAQLADVVRRDAALAPDVHPVPVEPVEERPGDAIDL